jgi:hypothetical protein
MEYTQAHLDQYHNLEISANNHCGPTIVVTYGESVEDWFVGWASACMSLLGRTFGQEDSFYKQFYAYVEETKDAPDEFDCSRFIRCRNIFKEAATEYATGYASSTASTSIPAAQVTKDPIEQVEYLVRHFHAVALALRTRSRSRPPLLMKDEYDVQYLFGALLRLYFEDVRPEEYNPSHAGGPTRVDFYLRTEQIMVELKKPRSGQNAKSIGDDLLLDINRYGKTRPDVTTLMAFVYDPDYIVANPQGLMHDLDSHSTENLLVRTFVIQN